MPKPEVTTEQEIEKSEQQIHNDNLLELHRLLESVVDFVHGVKDPKFGHVRLRIMRHTNQDLQWLNALTSNSVNVNRVGTENEKNPLLHSGNTEVKIMGKLVGKGNKPIEKKHLTPNKNIKAKFANDVTEMHKSFLSLRDKDIIAFLEKPGSETVIRGVAKLAGIKDFESCEIDVTLFADIRESIREKARTEKLQSNSAMSLENEDEEVLENEEGGNALDEEQE